MREYNVVRSSQIFLTSTSSLVTRINTLVLSSRLRKTTAASNTAYEQIRTLVRKQSLNQKYIYMLHY